MAEPLSADEAARMLERRPKPGPPAVPPADAMETYRRASAQQQLPEIGFQGLMLLVLAIGLFTALACVSAREDRGLLFGASVAGLALFGLVVRGAILSAMRAFRAESEDPTAASDARVGGR